MSACGEFCSREDCVPDEDLHVNEPFLATRGGPIGDDRTPAGTIDVTHSVGVARFDTMPVQVSLDLRVWMRDTHGWTVPIGLMHMLPSLGLTSDRARHLAELLVKAATETDRLNEVAE